MPVPSHPPAKPFDSYKWRWATFAPTEGLNDPPVFLGVLRALRRHEGEVPSTHAFLEDLARTQRELRGRTEFGGDLVRTSHRNVIRNSGQYWKALGVLDKTQPITLSSLGRQVADGVVQRAEFAAAVVAGLTLPNVRIEKREEVDKWRAAGLEIRPLRLLLEVIALLVQHGQDSGFLSVDELIKVVIPLAGEQTPPRDISDALLAVRQGDLDVSEWPDCAPEANDKRMAREFLRFLRYHGYLLEDRGAGVFHGDAFIVGEAAAVAAVGSDGTPEELAFRAQSEPELLFVERKRQVLEVLQRPGQAVFRHRVLAAFGSCCVVTGEELPAVLEAAHIIPVRNGGSDEVRNGLCLRTDIHALFDAGHLRLYPGGRLWRSSLLCESVSYSSLPERLALPSFVSEEALAWRINYE